MLLLTGLANLWFLAREARRRGGSFLSPGMRKAFGALIPSMLTAGVLTVVAYKWGFYPVLPILWMTFYGLALLAASQVSPQAIPRLGWAFLLCGLISIGLCLSPPMDERIFSAPHLMMALTFGGLHLLYAVCTWSTREPAEGTHV